jgi:nucleoside-diphosphate-sugar epimerase
VAAIKLVAASGASGLIGTALKENLSPDFKIVHEIKSSIINISNIAAEVELAASKGAKDFIHLGWPASSNSENYRISTSNFDALEKSLVLRRACEKFNMNFIAFGTPVDLFIAVDNAYSLTKYVLRQILLDDIVSKKITWLRPFYIFNDSSWPHFLHQNEPILIIDDSPRDFIHITDVVSAIESIIRTQIRGEVDVGTEILTRPSELCRSLGKNFYLDANVASINKMVYFPAKLNEKMSSVWLARKTQQILKKKNEF